ncbi:hypothetical protein DFH09DRAFT_1357526 [Mycena vulgaris]|nr:hypothetical protein DFH09DRAFT_1357526 [Mycena vulgaris]
MDSPALLTVEGIEGLVDDVKAACDGALESEIAGLIKTQFLKNRLEVDDNGNLATITLRFRHYLSLVNAQHRIAYTRFMLSDHRLAVEGLRHGNRVWRHVERELRLCRFCRAAVEDECHAFLVCIHPPLTGLRATFLRDVYTLRPEWRTKVATTTAYDFLMSMVHCQDVTKRLARFVYDVFGAGSGHTLTVNVPGPVNPDAPAPADTIVIVIGVVSDSSFFLSPTSNWNPKHDVQYAKPLEEAKYMSIITKPVSDPTFAPDFHVFIAAVKKYQSSISKTGINKWLVVKDGSEDAFRFAFPVFMEKDPSTEQNTNIGTWPVRTEARDELAGIIHSHSICVFHVFDTDHSLIDPVDIPNKLRGAIVECSTRILHFPFDKDNSVIGEIMQIVILHPKPVQPLSPYKKAPTKLYCPAAMSPADVHTQEQRAVNLFMPPSLPPVLQTSRFPPESKSAKQAMNPKAATPKRAKANDSNEDEAAWKDKDGESGSGIASGSSGSGT